MSVTLSALTDADRADVDRWLARAEADLAAVALAPPQRVVDTASAVLLRASFQPGQTVVPASLTLYRESTAASGSTCACGPTTPRCSRAGSSTRSN